MNAEKFEVLNQILNSRGFDAIKVLSIILFDKVNAFFYSQFI
jgi:hypothetical protein